MGANAYGVEPAPWQKMARLEQAVIDAAIAWEKTDHAMMAWVSEGSDLAEAVRLLLEARDAVPRSTATPPGTEFE